MNHRRQSYRSVENRKIVGMKSATKLLLVWVALFWAGSLFAQKGVIQGTILDDHGDPVIGANMVIQSLGTGAATNDHGGFVITKIPDGDHMLRVTYIGMDTATYTATVVNGSKVNVKIKMRE